MSRMRRGGWPLVSRRRLAGLLISHLVLIAGAIAGPSEVALAQISAPGKELRIDADQGLEWQRREKIVIARGNAQAVRGELKVQAHELRALYREGADGNSEIFRIIAIGAVRLFSANQTAYGGHAVYDVDRDRLLLTGGERVRLESGKNEISAKQSLEYWPTSDRLIATGDAVAIQPDRQIYGDTITAYFTKGVDGQRMLSTAEAEGNVKVVTADETIHSDQGNYDAKSGIATVTGSVKILRDGDQLDGCRGQMDFNTGVSRLFSCEPSAPNIGRVRGRIQIENDSGG